MFLKVSEAPAGAVAGWTKHRHSWENIPQSCSRLSVKSRATRTHIPHSPSTTLCWELKRATEGTGWTRDSYNQQGMV